jgi:hypothetical protein
MKGNNKSNRERAIIHITTGGKNFSHVNYSRRIYAVVRRYTPDAVEYGKNECLAELTGLRTFFKMSYRELAWKILKDVEQELGMSCSIREGNTSAFDEARRLCRSPRSIATYKEFTRLFATGNTPSTITPKVVRIGRKRLTIPYLGKVK